LADHQYYGCSLVTRLSALDNGVVVGSLSNPSGTYPAIWGPSTQFGPASLQVNFGINNNNLIVGSQLRDLALLRLRALQRVQHELPLEV
jgi:hypothetical protein